MIIKYLNRVGLVTIVVFTVGCGDNLKSEPSNTAIHGGQNNSSAPYVVVLGIAQDAGYPQAGCQRECCQRVRRDPSLRGYAACLAIVDPVSQQRWMLECTPDFREQLQLLDQLAPTDSPSGTSGLSGILLTHAHVGHYTGLIHLGHEAMEAAKMPVHAMPRLTEFLKTSGPWSQLVDYKNIELRPLADQKTIELNDRIRVTPLLVPHRDEFSETVAFRIEGPDRSVLFVPDIDKWERWDVRIEDVLATVDLAYVDGTFYADGELPGRSMDQIPHPFIAESIERVAPQPASERGKIRFFHFNHTNPAHDPGGDAAKRIRAAGHDTARQGDRYSL